MVGDQIAVVFSVINTIPILVIVTNICNVISICVKLVCVGVASTVV